MPESEQRPLNQINRVVVHEVDLTDKFFAWCVGGDLRLRFVSAANPIDAEDRLRELILSHGATVASGIADPQKPLMMVAGTSENSPSAVASLRLIEKHVTDSVFVWTLDKKPALPPEPDCSLLRRVADLLGYADEAVLGEVEVLNQLATVLDGEPADTIAALSAALRDERAANESIAHELDRAIGKLGILRAALVRATTSAQES